MICTVRVAIKNLLIKINWDSFCIRNILIVIFEFPDHFHLFIGAVAGDIWSANCLIRQHSLRPLYVRQHTMNRIRISKYIKYDVFCSMPNMFAMCACAHREPSLEFIVITVIVAFFLLSVRVCLSLNVCVRIVCCVSFAHSSHSNSHSHSHLLWLVECEYLFAWLCVLCMRACICYYFDMSMRLGRFTSTLRIYLCVLIFFSLHQITELLLVPLLLLLLYKWCAIICFFRSLSLSLACLLAHSLIHSLRSSSFSVSLPIIL